MHAPWSGKYSSGPTLAASILRPCVTTSIKATERAPRPASRPLRQFAPKIDDGGGERSYPIRRDAETAQQPFEQDRGCRIEVNQTANFIDRGRHGGIAVPAEHAARTSNANGGEQSTDTRTNPSSARLTTSGTRVWQGHRRSVYCLLNARRG
jgi:hypothetical protein